MSAVIRVDPFFLFGIEDRVVEDLQRLVGASVFPNVLVADQNVLAGSGVLDPAFEVWIQIDELRLAIGYGLRRRAVTAALREMRACLPQMGTRLGEFRFF